MHSKFIFAKDLTKCQSLEDCLLTAKFCALYIVCACVVFLSVDKICWIW